MNHTDLMGVLEPQCCLEHEIARRNRSVADFPPRIRLIGDASASTRSGPELRPRQLPSESVWSSLCGTGRRLRMSSLKGRPSMNCIA